MVQLPSTAAINDKEMSTIFLDHSISMWRAAGTNWHLNYYSAIAMASTASMTNAWKSWLTRNGMQELIP
eukprot:3172302-Amphidinium_carterae.1